ncbi:hypothetical protein AWB82_06079 [Caballeronia glebae]|uniref:ATP-binding protein n=1 Tax=Caballeronia glebae TaxID=1777143 RepID=A0A158D258_9BURK|nr:protein DpdH [Caballeronia glebae]SAK87917.1 hypothetical protein AWB82_06079 [Caballeronia glebae]
MRQNPCWNELELHRILKPDAEEISDHVFRAVHCPTDLQVAHTSDGERSAMSPDNLIATFLDPGRDYVQAVVLGESGTGKSHLIQWLRMNIPEDESTVSLTIPRAGTSLRGIVERIISRLPEDERAPYEERLRGTGALMASQDAKVGKFLSELAWAIEHGGRATDPEDVDLATLLPNLLLDPTFRRGFFQSPGGTVDLIVQHVFVDPEQRDSGIERREFQLGDLPLDGRRYQDAAALAKDAIDYIKNEEGMEVRAIALMNRNLAAAIAQTLNFSADHLIDLMNSLRRYLARQGKRLILLIEDFARLQGIDTALLQALITPPGQGDERLCELRWAMAVTTGYYKRLEETVLSRTTLLVDMDLSKPASLQQLTSGYLNALRLGKMRLQGISSEEPIRSRCEACEFQANCLPSFGQVEGIGLFPFTANAIEIMATRTESLDDDGRFNARRFLRRVLEPVLRDHYADLEHGEFPSDALLKRVGGTDALRPIDRDQLERMDPREFLRRNTLLELWDGSGRLVNLSDGIHDAFGIPKLRDISAEPKPAESVDKKLPEPRLPQEDIPEEVDLVRKWERNNAMLPQGLVTDLRKMIHSALGSFIDWDRIGLRKATVFADPSSSPVVFAPASISFENQQTRRREHLLVSLELKTDATLAIEALLMYDRYRSWDFPDGEKLQAYLLEALRGWAIHIEQQLKVIYGATDDWDPANAAAELLTLATYRSGRMKIGDTLSETTAALMWEANAPLQFRNLDRAFTDMNAEIISHWPRLLDLLKNLSSGTKGGVAGNFVRVTPVVRGLKSLRRSLQLSQTPPNSSSGKELDDLAKLYGRTKEQFLPSLEREKDQWLAWAAELDGYLGENGKVAELVTELRNASENAISYGLNTGASRSRLAETLSLPGINTLDRTVDHARALRNASVGETLIRIAAVIDKRDLVQQVLEHGSAFLQSSEAAVENESAKLERQSEAGLKESENIIERSLNSLVSSLDALRQLQGERV